MNYRSLRIKRKIDISEGLPPTGRWIPISVAAKLSGYSGQTIRLWYLSNKINGLKMNNSPILVNWDDILTLTKK